jgi:hypothetical protein
LKYKIINQDEGRELELMMAKMEAYDGKTIHRTEQDEHGRTDFYGTEIKRYEKADSSNPGTIFVGSTEIQQIIMKKIIKHYPPNISSHQSWKTN